MKVHTQAVVRFPGPGEAKPPHKVESKADLVVPFNYLDNLKAWRSGISVNTFRFNARMDAEKLEAALQSLFEKDGWKKLGGRIRKNKSGNLEHHIPSAFSQDRPAFTWSHEHHDQSIQDHPTASRIPTCSDWNEPQFFEDTNTTDDFIYPAKSLPTKFNDWLKSDRGCLVFHVHTFLDCTLVTISWSHAWIDGLGFSDVLQAWSLVLAGRGDEVPPYLDTDVISEYLDTVRNSEIRPESHCLYDIRLKGSKILLTMGNVCLDFLRHRFIEGEERTVVLPAAYVAALKDRAMKEITGQRLSENDVLAAWRTKLITSLLDLNPATPVGLLQPYSVRGLFDTLPQYKAFTSNSTCFSYTSVPAGQILKDSLGSLALRIQTDLREQRSKDQAEAYLKLVHRDGLTVFGDWKQVMMAWTNWSRGGMYDLDFSGALMDGADVGAGKPAYMNTHAHIQGLQIRNRGALMGQDRYGNRWMYWSMRSDLWEGAKRKILSNAI